MIKEIDSITATKIIETRRPLGLFLLKENDKFVAIHNQDGNAWTEDFLSKEDCIEYLLDK